MHVLHRGATLNCEVRDMIRCKRSLGGRAFFRREALGNRRRPTDLETLSDQEADYAPDVQLSEAWSA